MEIFNVVIPNSTALTNYDIWMYARKIGISYFTRVCMLNELPNTMKYNECGIVNFNKTGEKSSYWVTYWKKDKIRIYFDSYGQITPVELQKYLKTEEEYRRGENVIQRNTDIDQPIISSICWHLCLLVLKALSEGWSYEKTLNALLERKSINTN